jgi:hypothetical protein
MELLLQDFQGFLSTYGWQLFVGFILMVVIVALMALVMRELMAWFCKTNLLRKEINDLHQQLIELHSKFDAHAMLTASEKKLPSVTNKPGEKLNPQFKIDDEPIIEKTDGKSFPIN